MDLLLAAANGERDKLMFRVKIQLPKELASQYVERIGDQLSRPQYS
jgi:hypothetical protein